MQHADTPSSDPAKGLYAVGLLPGETALTPLTMTISDRILDDISVRVVTTLPHSTIVRLMQEGDFPVPVRLARGRSGWRLSDVLTWIQSRQPLTVLGGRRA